MSRDLFSNNNYEEDEHRRKREITESNKISVFCYRCWSCIGNEKLKVAREGKLLCTYCKKKENEKIEPEACKYCNMKAAYHNKKCRHCDDNQRKIGRPKACRDCKNLTKFDRSRGGRKPDYWCWYCSTKARVEKYQNQYVNGDDDNLVKLVDKERADSNNRSPSKHHDSRKSSKSRSKSPGASRNSIPRNGDSKNGDSRESRRRSENRDSSRKSETRERSNSRSDVKAETSISLPDFVPPKSLLNFKPDGNNNKSVTTPKKSSVPKSISPHTLKKIPQVKTASNLLKPISVNKSDKVLKSEKHQKNVKPEIKSAKPEKSSKISETSKTDAPKIDAPKIDASKIDPSKTSKKSSVQKHEISPPSPAFTRITPTKIQPSKIAPIQSPRSGSTNLTFFAEMNHKQKRDPEFMNRAFNSRLQLEVKKYQVEINQLKSTIAQRDLKVAKLEKDVHGRDTQIKALHEEVRIGKTLNEHNVRMVEEENIELKREQKRLREKAGERAGEKAGEKPGEKVSSRTEAEKSETVETRKILVPKVDKIADKTEEIKPVVKTIFDDLEEKSDEKVDESFEKSISEESPDAEGFVIDLHDEDEEISEIKDVKHSEVSKKKEVSKEKPEKKKKKRKTSVDAQSSVDNTLFTDQLPCKRPRKVLDPKLKYYKVIYTDGRATRDFTVQTIPETSDQSSQHYPETTEQSCQTNNSSSKLKEMGTQAGRSIPYDTKLEDILKASIKVHINSSLRNLKLDI